jgi:hypothetical protein
MGGTVGDPHYREDLHAAMTELETILSKVHGALGVGMNPSGRFGLAKLPGTSESERAATLTCFMMRACALPDCKLRYAVHFIFTELKYALSTLRDATPAASTTPISLHLIVAEKAEALLVDMTEAARTKRALSTMSFPNQGPTDHAKMARIETELASLRNTVAAASQRGRQPAPFQPKITPGLNPPPPPMLYPTRTRHPTGRLPTRRGHHETRPASTP